MKVLVRVVQHIYSDKWDELEEFEKEVTAIEAEYGFPPKKRYRMLSGPDNNDTLNVEYEWESLAAMEAGYEKFMADPRYSEGFSQFQSIIKDGSLEIYWILPS